METASQDDLQRRVIARMRELTDPESRWHRSLWAIATVTMLDELVEVAEHTWSGVINEHALGDVKRDTMRTVETDFGVGSEAVRKGLLEDIKSIKPAEDARSSNALSRISQWRQRVAREYLRNWATYIESGLLETSTVELTARSIVTHLRGLGYSRSHLQAWLRDRGETLDVARLAREADKNLDGKSQHFKFLVASTPVGRAARSEKTLNASLWEESLPQFEAADNARSFDLASINERRTVEIEVEATDPFAALALLQRRLDRILTRAALADGATKRPANRIVLDVTANKLRKLPDPERLLAIPALGSWGLITKLENDTLAEPLSETLHLLAPHLQTTHGISLATLWAACEGLLGKSTQGGHLVASRLANILACAYPRHLAFDLLQTVKSMKKAGGTAPECRTDNLPNFVTDIVTCAPTEFSSADAAAHARLSAVWTDPSAHLKRVRGYIQAVLLRVYYHRNFVMHSAKLSAVSLEPVGGLAPVLVAAALNEMVSGLNRQLTPHALADRAEIEFDLLGTDASRPLHNLLA